MSIYTDYIYSEIHTTRFQFYTDLASDSRTNCKINSADKLDNKKRRKIFCKVRLFNDEMEQFDFNKNYCGADLIDKICRSLNIVEQKYFGLQYLSPINGNKRWLEPKENILKTFKNVHYISFIFMFRYYPLNYEFIDDCMTVYYLVEQLKDDIRNKKIQCSTNLILKLSALMFQVEFGDYEESQFRMIHFGRDVHLRPELMSDIKLKEEFIRMYKSMSYCKFLDTDKIFIGEVSALDDYGLELYNAKSLKKPDSQIGLSPLGIYKYKNNSHYRLCKWDNFISCYEIMGTVVISFINDSIKKQSKKFKTTEYSFLIDLIQKCESVYKFEFRSIKVIHSNNKMKSMKKRLPTLSIESELSNGTEDNNSFFINYNSQYFPNANVDIVDNIPDLDGSFKEYSDSISHTFPVGLSGNVEEFKSSGGVFQRCQETFKGSQSPCFISNHISILQLPEPEIQSSIVTIEFTETIYPNESNGISEIYQTNNDFLKESQIDSVEINEEFKSNSDFLNEIYSGKDEVILPPNISDESPIHLMNSPRVNLCAIDQMLLTLAPHAPAVIEALFKSPVEFANFDYFAGYRHYAELILKKTITSSK